MMQAVMLSILPQYCELIANGRKTLEIRKTAPKLKPPFTCYVYCSQGVRTEGLVIAPDGATLVRGCTDWRRAIPVGGHMGNGMVIGEFVCDRIYRYSAIAPDRSCDISTEEIVKGSCLTLREIARYEDSVNAMSSAWHSGIYAWHITGVKIYDPPIKYQHFRLYNQHGLNPSRPPQSWCYVYEK